MIHAVANAAYRARWLVLELWLAVCITAPVALPTPDGYRVVAYAMRQRALERHVVEVGRDASLTSHAEILERDAPVVYGA